MTKELFFEELGQRLSQLPEEEKAKFLSYYEEIIADYMENGCAEDEAIQKVGNPAQIAEDIMKEQDVITIRIPKLKNRPLNGILLVLGFPLWGSLLLSAILLVLSALIIIWCGPVITGAFAIAAFLISIISIPGSLVLFIQSSPVALMQLGVGIVCVGLCILFILSTYYIFRKLLPLNHSLKAKIFQLINLCTTRS